MSLAGQTSNPFIISSESISTRPPSPEFVQLPKIDQKSKMISLTDKKRRMHKPRPGSLQTNLLIDNEMTFNSITPEKAACFPSLSVRNKSVELADMPRNGVISRNFIHKSKALVRDNYSAPNDKEFLRKSLISSLGSNVDFDSRGSMQNDIKDMSIALDFILQDQEKLRNKIKSQEGILTRMSLDHSYLSPSVKKDYNMSNIENTEILDPFHVTFKPGERWSEVPKKAKRFPREIFCRHRKNRLSI